MRLFPNSNQMSFLSNSKWEKKRARICLTPSHSLSLSLSISYFSIAFFSLSHFVRAAKIYRYRYEFGFMYWCLRVFLLHWFNCSILFRSEHYTHTNIIFDKFHLLYKIGSVRFLSSNASSFANFAQPEWLPFVTRLIYIKAHKAAWLVDLFGSFFWLVSIEKQK